MCSIARHIGLKKPEPVHFIEPCTQEHSACPWCAALRRFVLLCAIADDMQMLSCSQLSLCLVLTKERILFVSGTRYVLLGVIARLLLNAITKHTAMLPLLCWYFAALRCGNVTTALSCINAGSWMLQGVDAVFQPIVGALSQRGL